jgi:hypothetical protein
VILAPGLAKGLRERWLASRYKAPRYFVFCNTRGRGLDYRDVGEGFRQAVKRAGLQQPGHANPSITLEVYAQLFDRADHATAARDALEASYRAINGVGGSTAGGW